MSGRTPSSGNLLDWLDSVIRHHGGEGEVTVSAPQRPGPGADLTIILRRRDWDTTARGRATIEALTDDPDVATVSRRSDRLLIRFADDRLSALGTALEGGAPDPLPTQDLAAGERWVIDFCNPNATKALHVGHLRDLALGHALASIGKAAGARVVRQSQVGDCGRSMGEAMAGYLQVAGNSTPASAGLKSDHFVGECYARYVAGLDGQRGPGASSPDAALSREAHDRDDVAEDLLRRWRARDAEATALLQRVRGWALEGQNATLARLGIVIDRTLLESEFLSEMSATTEAALERGVAVRTPTGSIVYETGRQEYPHLLLNRRDGFPTQHLRYVALWRALGPSLEGARTVGVGGDEWEAMLTYGAEILRKLCPEQHVHPTVSVLHGMVAIGTDVVKSSHGGGLLLDDLLDALVASDELEAVCGAQERVDRESVAAMVALGFCLGRPVNKRLAIDLKQLLDSDANAGWAMARAWVRAWDPRYDGEPDPEMTDDDYRFLLVRSQVHRRMLAVAWERLDAFALTRFHAHMSQWYLAAKPTPRLARAMRATLGSGLLALGLASVREPSARRSLAGIASER